MTGEKEGKGEELERTKRREGIFRLFFGVGVAQ